jgi:hypothetical protein
MSATHYCTYCDYYSRDYAGRQVPDATVYEGTSRQVLAHANIHPIASPSDMVHPLPREPYET